VRRIFVAGANLELRENVGKLLELDVARGDRFSKAKKGAAGCRLQVYVTLQLRPALLDS
jgi:hypothetical protein